MSKLSVLATLLLRLPQRPYVQPGSLCVFAMLTAVLGAVVFVAVLSNSAVYAAYDITEPTVLLRYLPGVHSLYSLDLIQ